MKKIVLILMICCFLSCKDEVKKTADATTEVATPEKGQALFEQNNCMACHKTDQKVIGPSLQETARIYKEQKGDMVAFFREEAGPIVDEKLYQTMKTNLQITKTLSDGELESLEMYILSHSK